MAKERHTTIFFDEEVSAHLVSVLNDAQKFCCIVTPFVRIAGWTHVKNAIERAVNRNVDRGGLVRLNSAARLDKWNHAAVVWAASGAGSDLV